ncbi:MAG: 2-oxoglutarate dehydrogenase E1 [Phycisphaerae bacterium]
MEDEDMKVISLLQPWATLWLLDIKRFATRSWQTRYRGLLLVHASKRKDRAGFTLWYQLACRPRDWSLPAWDELPFGSIIGKVHLIDCVPTEHLINSTECWVSGLERMLGDFSPGRFAWYKTDPVQFATPIPARGRLGLWEYNGPLPEGKGEG